MEEYNNGLRLSYAQICDKIKGKIDYFELELIYLTIAFFIFLVTLVIVIPFRMWQYSSIVEWSTGFFRSASLASWGIWIVYGLSFLLMAFFIMRDKNTMDHPFRNGTKGVGFAFAVFALVFVRYFLNDLSVYRMRLLTADPNDPVTRMDNVILVFSVVTVLSLVIISVLLLINKTRGTVMKIIMLVPVVWTVFRLWLIYMYDKPTISISEHLIEILSYFSVSWFLMSFAYCVAGFHTVRHQKQLTLFGFIGAVMLFSNTLGKLFVMSYASVTFGAITPERASLNLGLALIMSIAPLYVCFGVDPLLDYQVMYESELGLDDPLAPFPSIVPVIPTAAIAAGLAPMVDPTELDIWAGGQAIPSDIMDESYRQISQMEAGKEIITKNPFLNNPNFVDMARNEFSGDPLDMSKEPGKLGEGTKNIADQIWQGEE